LSARGYDFKAGLEVEFHVFKVNDPKMQPAHAGQPGEPPDVSLLSHGYQYLTERYDQMEPVLELIRRDVVALGLPPRSIEVDSVRASANLRLLRVVAKLKCQH
jgi:glutamine synthetase